MITVYKYLPGNNRNEGRELFTVLENCRTGSNGLKLRNKKFRLDIRKKSSNKKEQQGSLIG